MALPGDAPVDVFRLCTTAPVLLVVVPVWVVCRVMVACLRMRGDESVALGDNKLLLCSRRMVVVEPWVVCGDAAVCGE